MLNTRFKKGDKVLFMHKGDYPGGAVITKQALATERRVVTISDVLYWGYYTDYEGNTYSADDSCLISTRKPTLLIKRK